MLNPSFSANNGRQQLAVLLEFKPCILFKHLSLTRLFLRRCRTSEGSGSGNQVAVQRDSHSQNFGPFRPYTFMITQQQAWLQAKGRPPESCQIPIAHDSDLLMSTS